MENESSEISPAKPLDSIELRLRRVLAPVFKHGLLDQVVAEILGTDNPTPTVTSPLVPTPVDTDLPIVHTDFGPLSTPHVQDVNTQEKNFLHDLRQLMERFPSEIGVPRLTAKAKDGAWTAVLYTKLPRKA